MGAEHICPDWAQSCTRVGSIESHVRDWTAGGSTVRLGIYQESEWDKATAAERVTVTRWIGIHGDAHELGQLETADDARQLGQALTEAADLLERITTAGEL